MDAQYTEHLHFAQTEHRVYFLRVRRMLRKLLPQPSAWHEEPAPYRPCDRKAEISATEALLGLVAYLIVCAAIFAGFVSLSLALGNWRMQ